ncbi:MAG TPA: MBL fold metallo-hydrolase [Thermoanaerobaculia bacterium]|nr:MBL fold metallo-hydrolase [Thermoanaerobaculia bacterium]
MKTSFWRFWVCSVFALLFYPPLHAAPPHVIFGKFVPGSQPDGNSVVFATRDDLVIVDTGRHRAHTQQILDYARGKKIAAIVNTHWHLDHIGGNALFGDVPVYASGAFFAAREGSLANYAKQLEEMIEKTSGDEQERYRTELALIRNAEALIGFASQLTRSEVEGPLEPSRRRRGEREGSTDASTALGIN